MSDHSAYPTTPGPSRQRFGQASAIGFAIAVGLMLAAYGAAGSYSTLTDLARRNGLPLPAFVPLGIDGGLVGVVVLDLVLSWTGQPLGWLRQLARLITMGTVAANAAAGYPHPLAVGLHAAAPVMLLAMVEAGRAVLLRRMGAQQGMIRDHIPFARWILAPWRTTLMWRRMVLWQISSYHTAIELEHNLRYAGALLRAHHGRRWKRKAPAAIVWRLTNGISVEEAYAAVHRLVDPSMTDARGLTADSQLHTGEPQPGQAQTQRQEHQAVLIAQAREFIENRRALGITVGRGRLAQELNITPAHARKLLDQLRPLRLAQ